MRTLSREVLDDAIEMTLRSERLPEEQKAGLIRRLQLIRDGFCNSGGRCDGCAARCTCEELVRRTFAGDAGEGRGAGNEDVTRLPRRHGDLYGALFAGILFLMLWNWLRG
ncbi:MAG TPA: hypothetical protein VD978_26595 [Azospirillum sp.]|nr:hypothetical protein [Azospirillum sp.]